MPDVSDMELLRDYGRQGSEAAFAELVQRHINLVYSTALRHAGIAAHAEEITQAVFVILARKAAGLRPDTILDAWLYQTTRLTSLSFMRGDPGNQAIKQALLEARDYFRTELIPSPASGTRKRHLIRPAATFSPSDAEKACSMGEELADKLARRAEAVFAHQPFWQRKYQSARGREYILMSMRHWLAGVLAKENPVLFRQLPESFKIGLELPPGAHGVTRPTFGSRGRSPHHRFVHGCELLPV